ncbi:MAG: hypothetical protein HYV26_15530 [Candidatus Hydrogenedentes bacterium]|nr:hypothetical protein [Candidatus Hydrogenedentota bacterium]MBI3117724.1 hypothetical protein [Candidatus Hydrogenedentota bacterium]
MPKTFFRRVLVAAGILCMAAMGMAAAAVASTMLEGALAPHDALLNQAISMGDVGTASE